MFLKYGDYYPIEGEIVIHNSLINGETMKLDPQMSYIETWIVSGTIHRERKPNRGNHRGRYYKNLNGRSK